MQAALRGVDTLVILRDDIHPALHDVGAGQPGDQVVLAPPRWGSETICSHARSLTLIDAAAAQHGPKCTACSSRGGHLSLQKRTGLLRATPLGPRGESPLECMPRGEAALWLAL